MIVAIGMAQYIIAGWVEAYGDNREIVSHVSFAGTIVSIILAVLAIVYSYYQTFSQQRDSATLSAQLEAMGRVVEDIRSSRHDLSAEVDRFAELGGKIDRSIEIGEDARTAVQQVSSAIQELKTRDASQVSQATTDSTIDTKAISHALVEDSTYLQLACFYALYFAIRDQLTTTETRNQIIRPAYVAKEKLPTLVEWVDGIWTGSFQSLVSLGLVKVEITRVDERVDNRFRWMHDDFRDALLKKVATKPDTPDSPFLTLDSVRETADKGSK